MNAIPLIRRKLTPARLPDPYIQRQKLISHLQLGLEPSRRLTLVCGGPGYGKSTLVAAYLRELELPCCWYALEESDAELTTFLTYLVGAVSQALPALSGRVMDLVRSASALEPLLQTIIGLLAEDLAEAAEDGAVLVLDDFQSVGGVEAINRAVELLAQYLPDNWQLVLVSREVPNLPLAQMRVRQQLVELGVRELRFAPGELRELLQRLNGVVLTDAEALEILGATDGWVASVILAAQAVRGSAEDAKALLMRELDQPAALYDYLAQEVFSHQPPAMQDFLLKSALLPAVDAASCREALGLEDAGERIRQLIQGNLLIPEGPEGQSHGYHPSFKRFLCARLAETLPAADLEALHQSIGRHLAASQPESALDHLLAGGDADAASALLADMAEGLLANNQPERLRSGIERFAPDYRARSFSLSFYTGEMERLWGNFDQALGHFQRAAELAGSPAERGRALVHMAAIGMGRGDTRAGELLSEGEALLPDDALPSRAFAHNLRGVWAMQANETQRALAAYEMALACYRQLGDALGQAKVLNNLGICYTRFGQFEEALSTYREAIAQSELAGRYPHPMLLNNMASLHYYQGRFREAWEAAERAMDLAQLLKARRDALYAHLSLGLANAGLGDWRRAEEHYEACRDGALALQDKATAAKAYTCLAESALLNGQPERARALVQQGLDLTGLPLEDPRCGDAAILLGLIELENGRFEAAQALLDRLEREFDALNYRYRLAQVLFYQARLAERRQTPAEARWERACRFAETHGYHFLCEQELRFKSGAAPTAEAPVARPALEPAIAIQCFGELQVRVGDRLIANRDWRGFKTKLILAFLLAHSEGVSKDQLTDLLYAEMDTTRTATLVLISRLRHALEPALDKQTPSRFVHFVDGRYTFNFAIPYALDVQDFAFHCKRGADASLGIAERLQHWRAALALYHGPYLGELSADSSWLTIQQERYRRMAQDVHTALIRHHLAQGDDAAALAAAEANLAFDACCEFAHQVKMCCLAKLGQREGALRHFQIMKQLFERELGSPPARESQRLYEAISRGAEAVLPEAVR
ncbi:MAG TPA: BTAD domain-containing putative transcriptional regulator [Oscillatoriaceae cyanobacterium]